ncbi:MAG: hypothetical protein RMM30_01135 [Armatimonadota bacterium]|nr:hypothetical protein [Armatimonadota bacterium]MDW8155181.1 hypothetical protein [Armatimonadota bacterium]
MAHRRLASFQRHVRLVRAARSQYATWGYTRIFADLPGERPPRSLHLAGFAPSRPDLTCRDPAHRLLVVEAETCDTLELEETARQWQLFRAYADSCGGEFHLVVPEECRPQAEETLRRLGLRVDRLLSFPLAEA